MKRTSMRIALLTGASLSAVGVMALGVATPALAAPHDSLTPPVTNAGTSTTDSPIDICTVAAATADCFFGVYNTGAGAVTASAVGTANGEIVQHLTDGTVELTLTNAAGQTAEIGAIAIATAAAGNATANAAVGTSLAPAIFQSVNATTDTGVANFTNDGTLLIDANASASAPAGGASANATIDFGVVQSVLAATTGTANYTNNGTVTLSANAVAVGSTVAHANASVADAQYQIVTGGTAAVANFDNEGTLTINAAATATGSAADAHAFAEYLMEQDVTAGTTATATIVNNGPATLAATANANATTGAAVATATANEAFVQEIDSGGTGVGTITNSAALSITANANATGGSSAVANAYITDPISQEIDAVTGTAIFSNTEAGTVNMTASAIASATGSAVASAAIDGIVQTAGTGGAAFTFANAGTISEHAVASAIGTTGSAHASAVGLSQNGGLPVTLNDTNSGVFNVSATAVAPGTAVANAVGVSVNVVGATPLVATDEALATGTFTNSGTLNVVARATGATATHATVGGGTTTTALATANATGIAVNSGANNLTLTNTGTIDVDAIINAPSVGGANATGIRVTGNGTGLAPAADEVFTFTNDGGTIRVRQSVDGGATWTRGTAIDVSAAPNGSVINLLGTSGDGSIYGNIEVAAGDVINVEDGNTYFDGIINPSAIPVGGITDAVVDTGLAGNGTLNIVNGGNLELADPRFTGAPTMYDGPAYALVDALTIDADSTLTLQLEPATGGVQDVGTYPQIFTNTADLAGTLAIDVHPAGGLFADSYTWNAVIDAGANGLGGTTFDACVVSGAYAGSVLLAGPVCTYDQPNGNVNVSLSRVAFNEVAGLNRNGLAVGTGLECIYDTSLTGGVADMLADLFLISSTANFNTALNQLSGSVYANYLQSFPSLGVHYNDLIDHATNCEVPALAGSALECRNDAPVHVWGQADYQWRKADNDIEAGEAKSKRFTGLIGVDARVADSTVVGISGGYVTNNVRDNQFGDNAKAKGGQVGLYAAYDPGAFYLKGVGTYSFYNGDSSRNIDFTGLGTGLTFAGRTNGSPDVNMWTLGVHGGYRVPLSETSVLTPYLDYDYVNAKLKSFTEDGLEGADLTVESSSSKHSFLTGGLKWATAMGGVVPEVNLGYRYRFGDKFATIHEAFIGDTDCDFDVISASQKKGTFLAGLSVGGKVGAADLRIGYEGEFNGDVTSHSGNFKVVIPIGGHAAPPPPPPPAPVAAPPPPPPPPPAPPPPPPPPPVERGERG